MKKGTSGLTLEVVVILIVTVLALTLLTMFVLNTTKGSTGFVKKMTNVFCQGLKTATGPLGFVINCDS